MENDKRIEELKRRVAAERRLARHHRIRFSVALKQAAAELAKSSGSRVRLAAELGVGASTLDKWVAHFRRVKKTATKRAPKRRSPKRRGGLRAISLIPDELTRPTKVTLRFPSGAAVDLSLDELRVLVGAAS